MNEIYQQVVSILYAIWQRRTYALITAWVVSAMGWFLVAQIPNKYEASSRIYVDTDSMLGNLMRGMAVNTDILQQLNMVRQTLISRPNMEKVVRMTDLDLNAKSDKELEGIISDLQRRINLSSSGVNLFRLSFEDEDGQLARRVVQSFLTLFVEANMGASRKDLAGTRRFLDDQLRKHEQELAAAERRKAEFQQNNLGMLPGDSSYFTRMQNIRAQLAQANADLNDARVRRTEMQRHLSNVPPYVASTGVVGGPPVGGGANDLPQRIAEKQRRMDELRELGYTDRHPDVVIMKESLVVLQRELAEEQELVAAHIKSGSTDPLPGASSLVPNPLYEQLKIRLIEMDTQVASLQGRVDQTRNEMDRLLALAHQVPEVEAELARLNRDYNVIKSNYEKLLERRESARLAQDLETKTDGVQIRVIDPPQVPRLPSSPNRLLLVTGVLIAGLGAGVAVAFLMSQLHTTYISVQRLRDSFAFPVLGSISVIESDTDQKARKRQMMMFVIGLVGLFAAFAGVIIIEMWRGNLLVG